MMTMMISFLMANLEESVGVLATELSKFVLFLDYAHNVIFL